MKSNLGKNNFNINKFVYENLEFEFEKQKEGKKNMFRRNKVISLLVVVASVISMVPTRAADKLGDKKGVIKSAYALKNGGYLYDGYKGSNAEGIYYSTSSNSDKQLEDIDGAWLKGIYGSNYAIASDYDNEYLINLSSVDIEEEEPGDKYNNTANKLKKALKKTERYSEDIDINSDYKNESSSDLVKLSGAKYSDNWYRYSATIPDTTTGAAVAETQANVVSGNKLYGYTDENGKYIDVCSSANIYAYSSELDKMVKINKFSSIDNDYDEDTKLQAKLTSQPTFLAQDKDYIYHLVNVDVYDNSSKAKEVSGNTTVTVNFQNAGTDPEGTQAVNKVSNTSYGTLNWPSTALVEGKTYTIVSHQYTYSTKNTGYPYFNDLASLKECIVHDLDSNNRIYNNNGKTSGDNNGSTYFTYYPDTNIFLYCKTGSVTRTGTIFENAGAVGVNNRNDLGTCAEFRTGTFYVAGSSTGSVTIQNPIGSKFNFYGVTFTYSSAAISGDAFLYSSIDDLKAKFNAYMAENQMSKFTSVEGGSYSNGVFTFTGTDENTKILNNDFYDDTLTTVRQEQPIDGGVLPTHHTYIQKISKAQGKEVNEAYIPKTVDSYEISKGIYNSEDADDAYDAFQNANQYTVVNGKLQLIDNENSSIKVTTLNLKREKEAKFVEGQAPSEGHDENKSIEAYLVERGDDDEIEIDTDKGTAALDIDSDGNVWVINYGKIYEFDTNKFEEKYTCNSSLNRLSVYDTNSLIVWKDSGNVYTTIYEGEEQIKSDAAKSIAASSSGGGTVTGASSDDYTKAIITTNSGWKKASNGTWNFYDATGNKVVNKWCNDAGKWYFLKEDGTMVTGWLNNNGKWYYLGSDGVMKTGWINDGGNWYYLNSLGDMVSGWIYDGINWYCLNKSGEMLSNMTVDGYKLNVSGAWIG